MTEAGWTRATDVNQPGWYWLRRVGAMTVVEVIAVPGYEPKYWIVEGVNLRWSLGNMDGEFLGPISPDSYQQGRVDCLGDVKRYVERQIKMGEDFIGGPDPNIQRRVALDEVIEYCDRQLAQQAQDEKGVGDGKV